MASRTSIALCVALFGLAAVSATETWHDRAEPSQSSLRSRAYFRETSDKMLVERLRARAEADMAGLKKPTLPQQATNPDDKAALEAFYHATNGPKWSNSSGWLKGDPCQDQWYGLYCIDGRVLQINLVYNLLSGSIPSEITRASALQVLRLYSNAIGGELPPQLFQMSSLQILDVNYNEIGGTLPDTISCPNLTQLVLYTNNIKGIIPTNWDTPSLQILALSSNKFEGTLPPALGKLTNLTQLVVSYNQLTGSFPSEYGNLKNLQQFWLFQNAFTNPVIPNTWSSLTTLTDFQADLLKGELPSWLGESWSNLEILVMSAGYLTGEFPTSLCSLKKIQNLRLFNNSLTGMLPRCICTLTTLLDLELSDNHFTGPIPDCFGDLRKLQNLYLSRNNISGTLPVSMGEMTELQILDVSSNGITGSIPSSFANLVKETVGFALCYNKLSSVENGLKPFFDHIKDYSCELYSNPWFCPLSPDMPKECGAQCSQCNTGQKHTDCSSCISDQDCGFCNEGPNCLEGSSTGPDSMYWCKPEDWYSNSSRCP